MVNLHIIVIGNSSFHDKPTLPSKKGQVGNNQPKTDGGRHT